MAPTVGWLAARGAMFRKPPPTYYHLQVGDTWYIGGEGKESINGFHNELQGKKEQITALMEDPEIFKELGILIDPEVVT